MARVTPTKRQAEFYRTAKNDTKPAGKSKPASKPRNRNGGKSDLVYS